MGTRDNSKKGPPDSLPSCGLKGQPCPCHLNWGHPRGVLAACLSICLWSGHALGQRPSLKALQPEKGQQGREQSASLERDPGTSRRPVSVTADSDKQQVCTGHPPPPPRSTE